MKFNRHQLSMLLMSVSLVLLAGFLSLFLKKSWDDEMLALKKETGFLFINSIRGIEGRMMDRLITHNIRGGPGDSIHEEFTLRMPELPKGDSLKVMTFIRKENFSVTAGDTNIQVRIAALPTGKGETDMSGSLSMIVALSGKDGKQDSVQVAQNRLL